MVNGTIRAAVIVARHILYWIKPAKPQTMQIAPRSTQYRRDKTGRTQNGMPKKEKPPDGN